MKLTDLKRRIDSHRGVFRCVQMGNESNRKEVHFVHVYTSPAGSRGLPPVPGLVDFYETFGEMLLYQDPVSKDAAFYIGTTQQWPELDSAFRLWISDLSEEEKDELLPDWIDHRIVIGEIPGSGNYLLVPTRGEHAGHVFEFEHDGFEFIEQASGIEQFIRHALEPDRGALRGMASHMSFVENGDYSTQWWIVEMEDREGKVTSTSRR